MFLENMYSAKIFLEIFKNIRKKNDSKLPANKMIIPKGKSRFPPKSSHNICW